MNHDERDRVCRYIKSASKERVLAEQCQCLGIPRIRIWTDGPYKYNDHHCIVKPEKATRMARRILVYLMDDDLKHFDHEIADMP